ncbi:MAG: repressor LexA, partial [Alphaproteobacteria bacterium]
MLTRKQHELLKFIHGHLRKNGISPSFDEMKDALNLKSKSGIHRLITALEERGFIRRLAHRARALEVLKLPESVLPGGEKLSPNVIQGGFSAGVARASAETNDIVSMPLYGRIAAG